MNVFDDDAAACLVLRNEEGQYSLWPSGTEVPEGWRTELGPESRPVCLNHIQERWTAMAPAGSSAGVGSGKVPSTGASR